MRAAVARTLATAEELAMTPFAAASRDARDYLAGTTGAPREVLDELVAA
jgi:hypothetical protein